MVAGRVPNNHVMQKTPKFEVYPSIYSPVIATTKNQERSYNIVTMKKVPARKLASPFANAPLKASESLSRVQSAISASKISSPRNHSPSSQVSRLDNTPLARSPDSQSRNDLLSSSVDVVTKSPEPLKRIQDRLESMQEAS